MCFKTEVLAGHAIPRSGIYISPFPAFTQGIQSYSTRYVKFRILFPPPDGTWYRQYLCCQKTQLPRNQSGEDNITSFVYLDAYVVFIFWFEKVWLCKIFFQADNITVSEFNHDRAAESILNGLLNCGNFENIIKNIFKYLNATQLACLQKVSLNKQNQQKPWSDW